MRDGRTSGKPGPDTHEQIMEGGPFAAGYVEARIAAEKAQRLKRKHSGLQEKIRRIVGR